MDHPLRSAKGYRLALWFVISLTVHCFYSSQIQAQFVDLPPLESPASQSADSATKQPTTQQSTTAQQTPKVKPVKTVRQTKAMPNPSVSSQSDQNLPSKSANQSQADSNSDFDTFDSFDDVFQITHPGASINLDDPYQPPKVKLNAPPQGKLPQKNQIASRSPFVKRLPAVKRTGGTEYRPWWLDKFEADRQKNSQTKAVPITVDMVVISMLRNSPEIRALSQEPLIASTYVDVENANFDPISFLESKWDDTNEPVGNILTTNNSPFLKDHVVTAKAGFRKKTKIGTDVELTQNVGFKNSNSEFFQPQDQGTARLELSVNQPLLNGSGKVVGTSRILLAEIDSDVSGHQLAEKLQDKILVVIKAYWELFYQKSVFELRTKNHDSAVEILRQLKGRESFDAQRSQIIRAEAAVAARRLELVRSRTDVKNAETIVRELTRDPRFGKLGVIGQQELMPVEFPQVNSAIYPNLPSIVSVAFHNRPEINQAMGRLKAASIQNDVAKNQLLPQLSLIVKAYSAALSGDSGIEQAWQQQFVGSTPGYSAGLVFEYPIYNRAAQAKKQRIEAEMTKLSAELDDAFGNITAEVEIAYRELKMAYDATDQSHKSIMTAERDKVFIKKRWENFAFLENQDFASPTIFLEQLLDSQDRITQAQIQYANSTKQFMIAAAELRKAEGSLLNYRALTGRDLELFEPETAPQKDLAPEQQP